MSVHKSLEINVGVYIMRYLLEQVIPDASSEKIIKMNTVNHSLNIYSFELCLVTN